MSASSQSGRLEESPEGTGGIPPEDILEEVSLPDDWVVDEGPGEDGLLLVENRDQERWQSISLEVSHRKNGDKIRGRHRKAPYRRDRVGSDPVERETFDTLSEAVDWIQGQL